MSKAEEIVAALDGETKAARFGALNMVWVHAIRTTQ